MNKPKYIVKPTSQFKKDYKSASKRNMNIEALDDVIKKDVLVLSLARTGTHSDLFGK